MIDSRGTRLLIVGLLLCLAAGGGTFLAVFYASERGRHRATVTRTTESLARESAEAGAATTSAPAAGPAAADGSYSVTMSPMGTVHFKRIPERIVTGTMFQNFTEMVVAVGHGSGIVAGAAESNVYEGFYRQLPRFRTGIDLAKMPDLSGAHPLNQARACRV